MDPDKTLEIIYYSIARGDAAAAKRSRGHLRSWLARGGFEPSLYGVTWGPPGLQLKKYVLGKSRVKRVRMVWPKIADIAADLRQVNKIKVDDAYPNQDDDHDGAIDVRLQVYSNGTWAVRFGSSQYDTDHHGYWGEYAVPGNNRKFNASTAAKELLAQAKDQYADEEG